MIHVRRFGRVRQRPQFGQRAVVEDGGDGVARLDHDPPDHAGVQVGAILAGPEGGDGGAGIGASGPSRTRTMAPTRIACGGFAARSRRPCPSWNRPVPRAATRSICGRETSSNRIALGDVGDLGERARLDACEMNHGLEAVFALVGQHGPSSSPAGKAELAAETTVSAKSPADRSRSLPKASRRVCPTRPRSRSRRGGRTSPQPSHPPTTGTPCGDGTQRNPGR